MKKVGFDLNNRERSNPIWNVSFPGVHARQLEQQFHNIEEADKAKIFITAAKILAQCPNPDTKSGKITGLALGKVQSGKTSSFITVTALAFDNKYRIVIILGGTKNNLLSQNYVRVRKMLGLGAKQGRKIILRSTSKDGNGIRPEDIQLALENQYSIVITTLKNHLHLSELKDILIANGLNCYPTLIIDDEGDQASLNALFRKGKKTATYNQIIELRNIFPVHAFISFTATPQANLLIQKLDDLSPEFCVLIEPGKGYTGGSTFHGQDQDKYIRPIPLDEVPFDEVPGIPESFTSALGDFLVGAAVRSLRGDEDDHALLVHTSQKKDLHIIVASKVKKLVENWKLKLRLPLGDPGREDVLKMIKPSYENMCEGNIEYPSWDRVSDQLTYEINNLNSPYIVNSSKAGAMPDSDDIDFKNSIYIGGNMLERGVTISGLAVTYITRWSEEPQADTLEQRARWFGYKQKYLDTCRVYMPGNLKKAYSDLLGHEDELWATLRGLESENKPLKEWSKMIPLEHPLKPTRPSVANYALLHDGEWTLLDSPEIDPERAAENARITRDFVANHAFSPQQFGYVTHTSSLISAKEIAEFVKKLHFPADNKLTSIQLSHLIERLDEKSSRILVLNMVGGETRERSFSSHKILELMQGHSTHLTSSDPRYYLGDREIHGGELQLQIHHIRGKSGSGIIPEEMIALAFYLPQELESRWVVGKDGSKLS